MKISKTKIQSCGEPITDTNPNNDDLCVTQSPYQSACEHINNAIQALSTCAKDDQVSRDAIANLSVVLFELK